MKIIPTPGENLAGITETQVSHLEQKDLLIIHSICLIGLFSVVFSIGTRTYKRKIKIMDLLDLNEKLLFRNKSLVFHTETVLATNRTSNLLPGKRTISIYR